MTQKEEGESQARKKPLSDWQKEDAIRLKLFYTRAKATNPRLTQERIAEELGITQGAVGHYLNGRSALNLSILLKFCRVLDARPVEISPALADQLPEYTDPEIDTLKNHAGEVNAMYASALKEKAPNTPTRLIALQTTPEGSETNWAGTTRVPNLLDERLKEEEIPTLWLARRGLDPEKVGVFFVLDDSLASKAPRGCLVIVDTRWPQPIVDGAIYAVQIGTLRMIRLRRLYQMPDFVVAKSDTPSEYPDFQMTQAQVDFGVLGPAVFTVADL